MLSTPERLPSQKVAFSYGASSSFSKVLVFIQGNEGSQIESFVVGPPFRPETRGTGLLGGVSEMSQNLTPKQVLKQLSVLCWARALVNIDQNSSLFNPMGSGWRPCGPRIPWHWPLGVFLSASSVFEQTPRFKTNSRCYAGSELWSTSINIEASFQSWGLAGAPMWPESHGTDLLGMVPNGSGAPVGSISIRTSRPEGRRAGRCILRRRDSRCVVS